MAEKIGSMLLAMAVRLVILRLLTRDILGFMSIPSAVVTVLLVIVDSGFSQSLVRHKGPSQSDYKSISGMPYQRAARGARATSTP